MWATVGRLLLPVLALSIGVLFVEVHASPTVASGVRIMWLAGLAVASGALARVWGCGRGQAIWVAWWLGIATALVIDVGLWTGAGIILSPVAVVVIQIAYMVFVAPLALFGWWAAGER
jgi:hypothetical protein